MSDRAFRFLFVAFCCLHLWKVGRLLPIPNLGDGDPLLEYHYSQIYIDVVHDRAFRRVSGRSLGYDPFTGGGQIAGIGLVPESHAVIVFDRLLRPFFRPDTTIKLFVGIALIAAPLLLFAAGRLFGFGAVASLVAAALLSAGMISFEDMSRTLIYRGHITFWLACAVAPFNAGSFYAWTNQPTRRRAAGFVVTWPLLLLLDPAVALAQIVPTVFIASAAPGRRAKSAFWLVGAMLIAVATNAFWLKPYMRFHTSLLDVSEFPSGGLPALASLLLPARDDVLGFIYGATRGVLFFMGVAALASLARPRRDAMMLFAVWVAALGVIALFGSHLPPFQTMEPARLSFAAAAVLLIPVGHFVEENVAIPGSRRVIFGGWLLWLMMTWQLVHPYDGSPLRSALTPREQRLLADLRRLPPNGRILVQYHPLYTDGLRLASVERLHDFVGFAGSWWRTRVGNDATFSLWQSGWHLFNRPLSAYDRSALAEALRTYDIAYIVTTAPAGHALFSLYDGCQEIPSRGEGAYRIFRVRGKMPGYLTQGGGRVTYDYDRLWIHGATAGNLVMSFHYADGFQTNPPLAVHAAPGLTSGPPLLLLENPLGHRDIEVRFGGN